VLDFRYALGDVAGPIDEASEILVGNFSLIDPEPFHSYTVPWTSARKARFVATHPELKVRNPGHTSGGPLGLSRSDAVFARSA